MELKKKTPAGTLIARHKQDESFPGCRVELIHMDDAYNRDLVPGCQGTVVAVDDIGTIHVQWDCGSSLDVVYGKDSCKKVDSN